MEININVPDSMVRSESAYPPPAEPLTTERKIRDFGKFSPGWCYGKGRAFSEATVEAAIAIDRQAISCGLLETDAFPGPDGEIRAAIYRGHDYLQFTVGEDKTIEMVVERNGEEVEVRPNLSLQLAKEAIDEFSRHVWASYARQMPKLNTPWISYALSAAFGMTVHESASKISLLRTQATVPAFPSLTVPA